MKTKTKKIIAREFIVLLAIFIISGLAYVLTYPFNYLVIAKTDHKEKISEKYRDSLITVERQHKSLDSAQIGLYIDLTRSIPKEFRFYKDKNEFYKQFKTLHHSDSLRKFYNLLSQQDKDRLSKRQVKNHIEFESIVNKGTERLIKLNQIESKVQSLKNMNSILSEEIKKWQNLYIHKDSQFKAMYFTFLFLIILAYPLRLIVIALIWSIKVLRR